MMSNETCERQEAKTVRATGKHPMRLVVDVWDRFAQTESAVREQRQQRRLEIGGGGGGRGKNGSSSRGGRKSQIKPFLDVHQCYEATLVEIAF